MNALDRLTSALAGHYTIERDLGSGGMATVYLARDLKHDRQVAIKLLRPDLGKALGGERFLREVQIAAQLRHPHILGLIDSGEVDDLLYYVMPFVEGESLRERVVRDGSLPVRDTIVVLKEVADALSAAHAHGIVHRDVKPENVMLEGRHALVMDFGVAKAVSDASGSEGLTSVGISLGTPAYMAPEQAAADPNVDHRADIYALGIVGYELLTGRPPFTDRSPQEILAAHVTHSVVPLSDRCPGVSPALAGLIMQCLAKRPEDRPQTADEIVVRLENITTPSGGTVPVPGVGLRQGGSRPGMKTRLGVAGIILLACAAAWVIWGRSPSGTPVTSEGNVIAVLPFTVRGDPDLAYLGEGIVNLLSTSLDGAGDIRSVNPHALLGYFGPSAGVSNLDAARAVAKHFNAGLFIVGDVFEVSGTVRVSASLFVNSGGPEAIAQATVEGNAGEVVRLVDALAAQLLAQQSVISGAIITEAATATTTSLPALKAYLDAEAAYRSGEYANAINGFGVATTLDSTFALAWYRLSMAQERVARPVKEIRASSEAAFRHSTRLSDHDRLFLEAVVATRRGQAIAAEQQFRELLQVYPDDAEAWYQLGELVFHRHPMSGGSMMDAREPFTQALRYDRSNIGALYHLMRVVARERDFEALDSLSEHYFALSPSGDRNLELRSLQAYSKNDTSAIAQIEADLASAPDASLALAVWSIGVFTEDLAGARRVAQLVVDQARPDDVRAYGYLLIASLDIGMGRWNDAEFAVQRSARFPRSDAPVFWPWAAAWPFAPLTDDEVAVARQRLRSWDATQYQPSSQSALEGVVVPIKDYVLGVLDAKLGDFDSSLARVGDLERVDGTPEQQRFAGELAQRVRAQVAVYQNRPQQALAILDSLQFEAWYGQTYYSGLYSGTLERFTKAELLRQQGRLEEALGWYAGLSQNTVHGLAFSGPATVAQAEINEQLGNREQALLLYDRFLKLWDAADPVFMPMVEQVRARRNSLATREG